jgi:hypothetical protein
MTVGLDVDELYVALDRQRRTRRMSWRGVAAEAGTSPSTLTRMAYGASPNADALIRLLLWLGTTDVASFVRKVPA